MERPTLESPAYKMLKNTKFVNRNRKLIHHLELPCPEVALKPNYHAEGMFTAGTSHLDTRTHTHTHTQRRKTNVHMSDEMCTNYS